MFFGIDFFSGIYAMQTPATDTGTFTNAILNDGTYDQLYLSTDYTKIVDNINDDWTYTTKLNATYENNLDGGNSGFSLKNTDTIVIKTRETGTLEWITIFVIPIKDITDFNFVKEYYYAKARTNEEFMCMSVLSGNINSYENITIYSDFEGICITDKDTFVHTVVDITYPQITRQQDNTTLKINDSQYPVVVSNSDANYDTGTITAAFLKFTNCMVDSGTQGIFRKTIIDWLCNKKPKILKLDIGRNWLIRITGTPSETEEGHPDLWTISFDFVEIGSCVSEKDLYKNNLSLVEPGVY